MSSTPEQQEADRRLNDAIQHAAQVNFETEGMVVDYVVLVQREDPTKPGQTQYNYFLAGGEMPWHRILGLLHVFGLLMAEQMANSDAEPPE